MSNQGCCGPIPDRIKRIKMASEQLAGAHLVLAEFYESMLPELTDREDIQAITLAVKNQRELSERSTFVTVPEMLDRAKEETDAESSELSSGDGDRVETGGTPAGADSERERVAYLGND